MAINSQASRNRECGGIIPPQKSNSINWLLVGLQWQAMHLSSRKENSNLVVSGYVFVVLELGNNVMVITKNKENCIFHWLLWCALSAVCACVCATGIPLRSQCSPVENIIRFL